MEKGLQELGQSIQDRRNELGLSQIELSLKSKVRQADISRLENGLNCKASTLLKILNVLNGELLIKWKEAQ